MPIYKVDDYAYTILAQKLSTVPGVSQVDIGGAAEIRGARAGQSRRARLARHRARGRAQRARRRTASIEPKGNLENAHQAVTLDTNDQLFDAAAFNNVIVAYRNGAPVRVKDIGQAIDSVELNRVGAWYRRQAGRAPAGPARSPAPTRSTTVDRIKALMAQLRASMPPTVKIDLVSDRTQTIRASVADVRFTLLLTIGLVVMVIFVFLRKLWATVIPGIAVPLSIIGTFARDVRAAATASTICR